MVGNFSMEDDESGQSYFLPHIFSPRRVAFSQWPQDNTVHTADQRLTKCTDRVKKCAISLSPLIPSFCLCRIRVASYSTSPPHGKFRCNFIHLTAAKLAQGTGSVSVPIHCRSLTCPWALLCVKIYVVLHGRMWNVYVPERTTCNKMQITAAGYDIQYSIYTGLGIKVTLCVCECFYGCTLNSFLPRIMQPNEKSPLKALPNVQSSIPYILLDMRSPVGL